MTIFTKFVITMNMISLDIVTNIGDYSPQQVCLAETPIKHGIKLVVEYPVNRRLDPKVVWGSYGYRN